ncbi:protein kinase [Xylogone sp. PMI_703]|nr:protein kinase [Xylogone sp. PMI_703]
MARYLPSSFPIRWLNHPRRFSILTSSLHPVTSWIPLCHRRSFTALNHKKSTSTGNKPHKHFEFQYMPLENVEHLKRYGPGGYHTVKIGDYLHDRYRIVHKLGFGSFSTIWLARDEKKHRYAGVKIIVADSDSHEKDILQLLRVVTDSDNGGHPGKQMIHLVQDEFSIKGPNGKHRCLVLEPARMSLSDAKDASTKRIFQLPTARAIAAQLILAIEYLHSQGIVHSDLHLGNVLLRLPKGIDTLSTDQLYEKYGSPNYETVERVDQGPLPKGVPLHGIPPVWLGKECDKVPLSEASILLTDFGEAFLPSVTSRYYSKTPGILVPPEIYFRSKEPVLFPSDIWTLGCAIFEIMGQRPLFEIWIPPRDWMVKEHVDVFGKLPDEWWQKWDGRSRWFDEEGVRKDYASQPWAERFDSSINKARRGEEMEELTDGENVDLSNMLRSMMRLKPEERLTAKEVSGSAWMRKWGLPEVQRMRKLLE